MSGSHLKGCKLEFSGNLANIQHSTWDPELEGEQSSAKKICKNGNKILDGTVKNVCDPFCTPVKGYVNFAIFS